MKGCIMNPVQQTVHEVHDMNRTACVLHLTRREGEAESPPSDPGKLTERMLEEIRMRATIMGPVLAGILLEAEGQPRWGLNE
jgi:hypothetical protein